MSARKKKTHGGARNGAGRPKTARPTARDGLVRVTAFVQPESAEQLEELREELSVTTGEVIEMLLSEHTPAATEIERIATALERVSSGQQRRRGAKS